MALTGRYRALAVAGAMALALAAAAPAGAAISYRAQTSADSTNSTLTINRPGSSAANDLMVATVSGEGTGVINAPSGWTLLDDTTTPNNAMRTLTYFKIYTASESASYAFTSSSSRDASGGIISLRGANVVVPIDAVADATGNSGNAVAPSVTTTAADDWVLTLAAVARDTGISPASGTTERYERRGNSTSSEGATATQAAAGATPARTVVPANTTTAWVAHTIALRDAATAGLSVSLGAASASFTSSLDDGDTAETWTVAATINDTRTSSSTGWQLQVTSTTMTTGARSLATDATDVTGVSGAACDNGAPCTLPTNNVGYPVDVPAAATAPTAVKFYNAAAGTGLSRIGVTANFSAHVPQNAYAGTYSSTVTISVISGP